MQELDWSVGELLATLDQLGLADNTLVIFSSDNGARYELATANAGHRSNAPLNGQKGDVWDGGNRIPFLARWPGHIPSGVVSGRLLCLTDLLATIASLTGQPLPGGAGEDSVNALPLLLGQPVSDRDRKTLIVQSASASLSNRKQRSGADLWAIRDGSWLLVLGQGTGYTSALASEGKVNFFRFGELSFTNSDFTAEGKLKSDAPPQQLYDLSTDLGQTNNVYRQHPDTVKRLNALFDEIIHAGTFQKEKTSLNQASN